LTEGDGNSGAAAMVDGQQLCGSHVEWRTI
jgi:hypothetical protein